MEAKWVWTISETAVVSGNNITLFATTVLHFPSSSSSSSSFQTVMVTACLPPSLGQPSSFLPRRVCWWSQQKFPFVGVRWEDFISHYVCKQSAASFHWKMSTTICRTQQAFSVHGVWISLLFSWAITSYCISFMLMVPINTKHNSLTLTISHSHC